MRMLRSKLWDQSDQYKMLACRWWFLPGNSLRYCTPHVLRSRCQTIQSDIFLFFIWAQAVDSCNQENPSATTAQTPNKYDAKILLSKQGQNALLSCLS